MKVVAYTELLILARVIVGALMLRNSFLTPIIYAHFVRMRYFQSAFTREAVFRIATMIDVYINGPDVPPVVKRGWAAAQSLIGRWTGTTLNAAHAAQPPSTAGSR
jgi:transmembrane protein 33